MGVRPHPQGTDPALTCPEARGAGLTEGEAEGRQENPVSLRGEEEGRPEGQSSQAAWPGCCPSEPGSGL